MPKFEGGSSTSVSVTGFATDTNQVTEIARLDSILEEVDSSNAGATVDSIVVSTTAVEVFAAAAHGGRLVTNIGNSNIYLGKNNTVTATGATAGHLLTPGGVYEDFGPGRSPDALWAIGDTVTATQNLSREQRVS